MDFLLILFLCLALVVLTSIIHYEVLRIASGLIPILPIAPRSRTLVTLAAAFFAHTLQISLYAVTYWLAATRMGLGQLSGALEGGGSVDYLYYSAATFTTLGVGDIVLEGDLRLLAGIQSLNGLVLITWSASFTYLSMEKFWLDG